MMLKTLAAATALSLATLTTPVLAMDGDPEKGAKVFRKCKACHKLEEGKRAVGPTLYGVMNREAGAVEGFKYSSAMKDSGLVWDVETMSAFLAKPKKFLKGTKMSFPGLKKEKDIADVIAYIAANGGTAE